MNTYILILAAIGFGLSVYAYCVKIELLKNKSYKPACDINDKISCSKPFTSSYELFFGIPNAIWGMGYYIIVMTLNVLNAHLMLSLVIAGGLLASLYLAFILYTKIKSFCLICTSIYIVNILLFMLTYKQLLTLQGLL